MGTLSQFDRDKLLNFTNRVEAFIRKNKLENLEDFLIVDYLEGLHNSGINLDTLDPESETYKFYAYYDKYFKYLNSEGEVEFINLLVRLELEKINKKESD